MRNTLSINTDIQSKGHSHMLTHIIEFINGWFSQQNYSSALERYIVSKNPQNNAEVETLEREFHEKLLQGKIL